MQGGYSDGEAVGMLKGRQKTCKQLDGEWHESTRTCAPNKFGGRAHGEKCTEKLTFLEPDAQGSVRTYATGSLTAVYAPLGGNCKPCTELKDAPTTIKDPLEFLACTLEKDTMFVNKEEQKDLEALKTFKEKGAKECNAGTRCCKRVETKRKETTITATVPTDDDDLQAWGNLMVPDDDAKQTTPWVAHDSNGDGTFNMLFADIDECCAFVDSPTAHPPTDQVEAIAPGRPWKKSLSEGVQVAQDSSTNKLATYRSATLGGCLILPQTCEEGKKLFKCIQGVNDIGKSCAGACVFTYVLGIADRWVLLIDWWVLLIDGLWG